MGFDPPNTYPSQSIHLVIFSAIPSMHCAPMTPHSFLAKILSAQGQKWYTRFGTFLDEDSNQIGLNPIYEANFLHLPCKWDFGGTQLKYPATMNNSAIINLTCEMKRKMSEINTTFSMKLEMCG